MSPLPRFATITVHSTPLTNGVEREAQWLAQVAATGVAAAHLWHAPQGLVATRSYERLPNWGAARSESSAAGWPVEVRASGGGLVPQGPGLLNISLLWRGDPVPSGTGAIYIALCDMLARALAQLAIAATPASVPESFCDGRFNLAVRGRKLAGTAQAWKKIAGQPVVLAHAVLIVDADLETMSGAANALEVALGSGRRYRAAALTSVALGWQEAHDGLAPPDDLEVRLVEVLAEGLRAG